MLFHKNLSVHIYKMIESNILTVIYDVIDYNTMHLTKSKIKNKLKIYENNLRILYSVPIIIFVYFLYATFPMEESNQEGLSSGDEISSAKEEDAGEEDLRQHCSTAVDPTWDPLNVQGPVTNDLGYERETCYSGQVFTEQIK